MKQISILLLLTSLLSCTTEKQKSPTPPNIVIIFTDDQGYQDLGCYGSPDIETPHLDQMAKEGIRFTNFYVSQPVCSASRASLLTGCYANRLGIHGAFMPFVGKGLNPGEETIAEILKPLGYATGVFGKWHLGSEEKFLPTRQGFDEYFGIPYSNDMWPHHPQQGTVFDFGDLPLFENEKIIDTLDDQSMTTTWYTDHAIDFIKKNKKQPFFLYLPHSQPHVPLFVSDKFKGKSKRGLYGDVISEIDWSVGQVLKTLKENNLDEKTLVIFASDNGPWLSYGTHSGVALPLREGKGTALEGGVRVPCIMRWPGNIPQGVTIKNPAMTIDLLPTIAKITGAKLPTQKIDGKEILGLLEKGKQTAPHHEAYYFYYKTNELHAILSGDGRWKLYLPHSYRSLNGRKGNDDGTPIDYDWNNAMNLELYDLENDLSETKDIATAHPDIVEKLLIHAEKARAELGDNLTQRTGSGNRPAGSLQ
ncbi:MAG: arylsulfatase A-like enzyme [Saprospiraceae bacterium]|jgi:arylsulfatase A-like enzyme